MQFNICSLYICVKDMDRAIHFYEKLLEQEVMERDEIYSVFDISGFRFGLFAFEKMNEKHVYGNNCLPSLAVDDIVRIQEKLSGLNCPIVFPLTKIRSNWVMEFADCEGNHIEVTAPAD